MFNSLFVLFREYNVEQCRVGMTMIDGPGGWLENMLQFPLHAFRTVQESQLRCTFVGTPYQHSSDMIVSIVVKSKGRQ